MRVEPVSLGELKTVQNVLNSTLADVVREFYMISEETIPYFITLRSSAFKIWSENRADDFEYFKTPITVDMGWNSIRKNENSVSNLSVLTADLELHLPWSYRGVKPDLDLCQPRDP